MDLYQAEWCPHSHRVRERLTTLGVDVVLHQVPREPEDRAELRRIANTDEIPVLVLDDGFPVCGADQIVEELDRFAQAA